MKLITYKGTNLMKESKVALRKQGNSTSVETKHISFCKAIEDWVAKPE
jgi:hypothetical protein